MKLNESHFLFGILTLSLLLGWRLSTQVTRQPLLGEVAIHAVAPNTSIRQVASTPVSLNSADNFDSRIRMAPTNENLDSLIRLECDANLQEFTSTHEKLRIKNLCDKYQVNSLVNRNNGFTAEIFNQENSQTTDYLTLSPGKNEIEIEIERDSLKIQKTIIVTLIPSTEVETDKSILPSHAN